MKLSLLKDIRAQSEARRAHVVVTEIATGDQRLVTEDAIASDELAAPLAAAFASGKSGMVPVGDRRIFLDVRRPRPRLVIAGAVHVAQALVPMAEIVGFDVTVIDPRSAFATEQRFPNTTLRAEWPDAVMPELSLDPYTAAVTLAHVPRIDDPVLIEGLRRHCFYVGALGSRKTRDERLKRLGAEGIGEDEAKRVHAPIGLDIKAATPAEIAVAILAEIIASMRSVASNP